MFRSCVTILRECALWISVPRPRDTGNVCFRLGPGQTKPRLIEPGLGRAYYTYVSLKFTEACYTESMECAINLSHTLLITEQDDICKFKFSLWDEDRKRNDFRFPSMINLIPEGQENSFWTEEKMVHFMIVRWDHAHFRGKFDFFNDQLWIVTWELIEADKDLAEHPLFRVYTKEDDVLKETEIIENLGVQTMEKQYSSRGTPQLSCVVDNLREQCDSDDIHLVCSCWLFSNRSVKVSTFKDNFCQNRYKSTSIYVKLDLSPIRPYFLHTWLADNNTSKRMSTEEFATALGSVRQQFVKLLHSAPDDMEHTIDELEQRFDRNFLHLSNWLAKDSDCFIVHDDRRQELHLVHFKHEMKHVPGWVRSSGCTYRKPRSEELQLVVRHNWIKYQCLRGQDDEFNIFRALCFAPSSGVVERYQIAFVALTLQILLSLGIAMDTAQMWSNEYSSFEDFIEAFKSFEYQFEETLVVTISIFTFVFILQRLRRTIESFNQFYTNTKEVCIIPKVIIALDFTSNIVVGTLMAIVTPFFLLQSEDIQTVVLNSFALTFFIELDDLANIYESDEPFLLQEDKNGWQRDWETNPRDEPGVVKRKIEGIGSTYKSLKMTTAFVFSPLYETFKIIKTLIGMCCTKEEQVQDQTIQQWTDSDLSFL